MNTNTEIYCKTEIYDRLGRNISEQEKRQRKEPWVKVKHIKNKIYIKKIKCL